MILPRRAELGRPILPIIACGGTNTVGVTPREKTSTMGFRGIACLVRPVATFSAMNISSFLLVNILVEVVAVRAVPDRVPLRSVPPVIVGRVLACPLRGFKLVIGQSPALSKRIPPGPAA